MADEQRRRLLGIKLAALVGDHLAGGDGQASIEPSEFSLGAAATVGEHGWVLLDDGSGARLGAALAWALRAGVAGIDLVAHSDDAGVIARRAQEFRFPISVWTAQDRTLVAAPPAPYRTAHDVPEHQQAFRQLIIDGGAEPTEEFGVLVGEVRGLEVCRVVDDAALGTTRLEVGVGSHDREAFTMVHGDVPTVESLARIAATVAEHRRPDADPHPLNRLGAERRLRWEAERAPESVGAATLIRSAPPEPRPNLKDAVPCVAHGTDLAGDMIVAVFSQGVDLELVPYAADARAAARAANPSIDSIRLVIVVPERDRLPITFELADLLNQPAEFSSPAL